MSLTIPEKNPVKVYIYKSHLESKMLTITNPGKKFEDEFYISVIFVLQHIHHALVHGRYHFLCRLLLLQWNKTSSIVYC